MKLSNSEKIIWATVFHGVRSQQDDSEPFLHHVADYKFIETYIRNRTRMNIRLAANKANDAILKLRDTLAHLDESEGELRETLMSVLEVPNGPYR